MSFRLPLSVKRMKKNRGEGMHNIRSGKIARINAVVEVPSFTFLCLLLHNRVLTIKTINSKREDRQLRRVIGSDNALVGDNPSPFFSSRRRRDLIPRTEQKTTV